MVQAQAPVDDVEEQRRILFGPRAPRRHQLVFHQALVRGLRPRARKAGIDRRAHRVNVGPGAELARARVLLGRGEARRVGERQHHAFRRERLAGAAEIDQQRRAVVAQKDVRRLDVEVQELVGMHLA